MPSQMIHFYVTKYYDPDPSPLLLLGNLAPDCRDVRSLKDKSHFRNIDVDKRLDALSVKAKEYDLSNDYYLGIILHLYTDFQWDTGPQLFHRNAYKGNNWFRDYRNEINKTSMYLYKITEWAPKVYRTIHSFPIDKIPDDPEFPQKDVKAYADTQYKYHTESKEKLGSSFFNKDVVDVFSDHTSSEFKTWIKNI